MNKKPYDRLKDFSFAPPSVVRTSRVRICERNMELINEFFKAVAKRGGTTKISVFTEIAPYGGEVRNAWTEVAPDDLSVEIGSYFKYVHRLGVSERIILEKEENDVRIQRVYAISG